MARPRKQTVDYFPHSCTHKKTMFILEQKYGNDGYAFWFKLLETLGSTEGHALDLKDESNWQYLQANTHMDDERCSEILNLLARLDAIDRDLWAHDRVVWSDNFIEGISDVYIKRIVDLPEKPELSKQKQSVNGVSGVGNPQSKVKESKVKESKGEIGHIRVQRLTMSHEEYQKLVDKYGQYLVDEKINYAKNYAPLMKKYKNLYLTLNNWLKSDAGGKANGRDPTNDGKIEIPDEVFYQGD